MRRMFTVWDEKLEVYLDPLTAMNKGEAVRIMENHANNPQSGFCQHAQDFTLFEIGEYDEIKGTVLPYKTQQRVAGLWELKKKDEKQITALQ